MPSPVRILSIDGGGIRGIIPALVLAELERRARRPICRLFDLIAGTSTGGILALGLVKGKPDGTPAYAAADLVGLYEHEGPTIFARSVWLRIPVLRTLVELFRPRYPARNIEAVLLRYFGDARLSQAITPALVTGYEIARRDPWFFRSERAKREADHDFPMRDVARATAAAPTYFPPLGLPAPEPTARYGLVDGGVFANNPALCAYVEGHTLHPQARDFLMVSLGTGQTADRIPYGKAKRWGLAGWARPLLSVVFDGVSDTVDYQLDQLLRPAPSGPKRHYRFQAALTPDEEAMDDASGRHIAALKDVAQRIIAQNATALATLARALTGDSGPS
jgi:uncharacterized protein